MLSTNTLGRYHIIRELARSNDIVYEAMDPTRGQRIALKELLIAPNLTGQARRERIERFTREARAAARLQHSNIVRIHDHGQAQGRYYIAMEFLEGQSLRDVLRQRGSLPSQECLRIAASVADGLEFAHKNGVVHRDVKPDNVHLEPDGRVVITDFGIARLTFEPTLTADGQIFGTPSYMSPEQVAGKNLDHRSDLFSLGVMLYEMISGRKPFTGDSVITITYNIMNSDPAPLAGGPPGVDMIVRRALSKDSQQRYRSAAEMAEDLRLVMKGASPRHAAVPMAPSSTPAPRPGGSNGARSSGAARPSPAPQPGPRPHPHASTGAPPAGAWGSTPAARPLPGPLPGPRGAAGYPLPHAGGFPGPAPAGAVARAPASPLPGPAGMAPAVPQRRSAGGIDWKFLFGWLGVAIVIGAMIIGLVILLSAAQDAHRKGASAASVENVRTAADRAFKEKRYADALRGYEVVAAHRSGELRAQALRNGAVSASQLAEKALDEGRGDAAEAAARRAIKLSPTHSLAYVALGRALVLQGDVERGLGELDRAMEIAQRNGDASALKAARIWKAKLLHSDGERLITKSPMSAERRFQQVIETAPGTQFAQSAEAQLKRLRQRGAGDLDGAAAPPLGTPGLPGGPLPGASGYPGGSLGTPSDSGILPPPGSPAPPPGWPGFRPPMAGGR